MKGKGVRDEGEGEQRKGKRVVSDRFIESSSEFDYRQPEDSQNSVGRFFGGKDLTDLDNNLKVDLQTRRTIGGGHERGGLYFLDTSPPVDACALSTSVSPLQWHCRLGHPSLLTLKKVLPIKSARLECKSYELEKHHRASFPPRVDKHAIPRTLVPLPVPILTIPPHTKPPTRPLQVYSHRTRSTTTTLTAPPGLLPTAAPGNPSSTSTNDLSYALRKVNLNLPMYQMDIKNAFLYGDLNENIYMEQPLSYVAQGEKQLMVCKLKKAIYGLKQSPRAWFDKFSCTIVILSELKRPRHTYGSTLSLNIWGGQGFFGIEIAHSKHGVSLSQRKYACDLLQEASLLGTNSADTPMDSNPDF
ncbi:UNVERIFIED_CONTAM: Retrovirus-related Pol polyprotein from transposon TNT 1-94 [Sesamum calycinum]|uniref:Retrovirus-related Pol polyprotein from transposon TNT 1-94 n=1 Tax=Sesamum calycinum TaxID=2727403 RepID=A0AAW2LZ90_9LAMI